MARLILLSLALFSMCGEHVAAETQSRPNILFAIADDASFPHMSAYGTSWVTTPAFDSVARAGLRFDRCYTPNAKCAPSRSCILTGKNSWQLGAAANHWPIFPPSQATFVESLTAAGYHCGMTGKGWGPGIAVDADGKPREMTGKPYQRRTAKPPTPNIGNRDYAANFDDFLADAGDEPFFFWYGATEPHRSYEYGSGVAAGKRIDSIDHVPAYWPDNETVRNDILDYALEIEYFDLHLSRMLERLRGAGKLDNTIVIVTSDNGMPFPRVKGQSYEQSHHMPMAIQWPAGIDSPGRVVDDLVSFIDIAPTLLDVAGLEWAQQPLSGNEAATGHSWTDLFRGEPTAVRNEVLIGKERHDVGRPGDAGFPVRGIIKGSFLLIRNLEPTRWPAGNPEVGYPNTDGGPTKTAVLENMRRGENLQHWQQCFGLREPIEMYNVLTDPDCVDNLAKLPQYDADRRDLLKTMAANLIDQDDPRAVGGGDVFDQYPYSKESDRGFYERYMQDPKSVNAGWISESDVEKLPLPAALNTPTSP